jgi:hypothetical protein
MESTVAQTTTMLLTLPIEIRRLILGYAFIAACAPIHPERKYTPLDIRVTSTPRWMVSQRYLTQRKYKYGVWGQESMSRILRINHQLRSEATEVLYGGDFVFHFLASPSADDIHRWLHVIGDKKSLLTKIAVRYHVHLGGPKMTDATGRGTEGFAALKRELVNLKSVEMRIVFERTPFAPIESEKVRQLVLDALTDLVGIFRGLATLVIENHMFRDTSWKGFLDACFEKMDEAVN